MPESILNTRWVPPSLFRQKNVAKYEAATGRLIWWRELSYGAGDLNPRQIAPIHGTEDVAVLMRGSYETEADPAITDYVFRLPGCGIQEMSCIPWVKSMAEDFPATEPDLPWQASTANIRDSLFDGANGTTYLKGASAYYDVNLPGYVNLPFTRGYTTAGVVNFSNTLSGPLIGIPTTSDFFGYGAVTSDVVGPAEPNILMIQRPISRVGPGTNWTRPFFHFTTPICANAAGHLLLSFQSVRPYGTEFANARGCLVTNGTGAQITWNGYEYYFFVDVTPTTVTLLDNSLVAANYDSFITGQAGTFDPDTSIPMNGCSYGDRWYVNGVVASDDTNIRCYGSSLAEVWRVSVTGAGGQTAAGCLRQMLADDRGVYLVGGPMSAPVPGANCSVVKLDHDGNVIYGLNSAPAVSACLSDDGKYLYATG